MKSYSNLILVAALLALAACGGGPGRPVYTGHQESTEGVPGFVNGKKVSPHVKLGQSYSVDGELFVPRHEPDYVEEGMASWYGPGFHGGKTANGERFDSSELTAAHRTLPLPSIVRVTMLSTGKQVIVRVNDRGPFAHSRIIDLSRGAAEKIGLLRSGVAKVRVEYLERESHRFAELLSQGREPKSIDIASEVLDFDGNESGNALAANTRSHRDKSLWDKWSPVSQANASEIEDTSIVDNSVGGYDDASAPVSDVEAGDLDAPQSPPSKPVASKAINVPPREVSPFDLTQNEPTPQQPEKRVIAPPIQHEAAFSPQQTSARKGGLYVQLGAFSNETNAKRLLNAHANEGPLSIVKKDTASGATLFHVRSGPFASAQEAQHYADRIISNGAEARLVKE